MWSLTNSKVGPGQRWQPARHITNQGDAFLRETKYLRCGEAKNDEGQGPRHLGRLVPQAEDDEERRYADHKGQRIGVRDAPDPTPHFLPGVGAVGLGSGELGEFSDHDFDCCSEQEPGYHSLGEELRDPPHLEDRQQQEQQPGGDRDRSNQRYCVIALRRHAGRDQSSSGHCSQRRTRARRDLTRRPEECVDQGAGGRGVEAVLNRDPGDAGVAQCLGDNQCSHCDPCDHVGSQPPALILGRPRQYREDATQPGWLARIYGLSVHGLIRQVFSCGACGDATPHALARESGY